MNPFDVHILMEQCFNHQDFFTTKLSWFMSLSFPKKKSGTAPVASIWKLHQNVSISPVPVMVRYGIPGGASPEARASW